MEANMMIAEDLRAIQKAIDNECLQIARKNGLIGEDIAGPIYDGVPNEELYLKSSPRVLWILQEPHDSGAKLQCRKMGNWSVPKDMILVEDYGWGNRTHEPIAKTMYAFRNELRYSDIDKKYRTNEDFAWEVMRVLQSTAWINVSKMPCPNGTRSNGSRIKKAYNSYWRDVVIRQVNDILRPEIIIVAGSQWSYVADDLASGDWHEEKGYPYKADRWRDPNGRQFIWVDHPTARKEKYFDVWVDALRDARSAL